MIIKFAISLLFLLLKFTYLFCFGLLFATAYQFKNIIEKAGCRLDKECYDEDES